MSIDKRNITISDFFRMPLNKQRIKTYRAISKEYKIDEGTVAYIFGEGIKFAMHQVNNTHE